MFVHVACTPDFSKVNLLVRPHDTALAFPQTAITPKVEQAAINPFAVLRAEKAKDGAVRFEMLDRRIFNMPASETAHKAFGFVYYFSNYSLYTPAAALRVLHGFFMPLPYPILSKQRLLQEPALIHACPLLWLLKLLAPTIVRLLMCYKNCQSLKP